MNDEPFRLRREYKPPGVKHGPGYRRRHDDFKLVMEITGTVNSRPWRGAQPRTCLIVGTSCDRQTTKFEIKYRASHDLRVMFGDTFRVEKFRVYRGTDFNRHDLGELVIPDHYQRWAEQLAL